MVRIERITTTVRKQEPATSPYDHIIIEVNDKEVLARPLEWDSEQANSNTLLNQSGESIKPTKAHAQCPECYCELLIPLNGCDGSYNKRKFKCSEITSCSRHMVIEMPDPFWNPVDEKLIAVDEIDVKVINNPKDIQQPVGTLADRMRKRKVKPGDDA